MMTTFEFWKDRLIFFAGVWAFTVVVASFVIIVATGGVNAEYWRTITNIGVRAFFNFISYITIFSYIIRKLNHYFPFSNNDFIVPRLIVSAMATLFVAYNFAILNASFPFPEAMKSAQDNFFFILTITFFQCVIIFTVIEIYEMIKRNRTLKSSIEQLEKEKIKSQLEVLRQQVNPHFLFNSLNVLSELIHEDLDKSDLFIQHFAKVYRYVLEINQEAVVTLQKEFDFLSSYIFLQKIRFGETLQIQTELPQSALQQFVPPLSLQILFENAIKHNAISATAPLTISIKCENDILYIKNNFQELKTETKGAGIGLQNLKNKYKLISDKTPKFYLKDGFYMAELPLIQIEA